MHYRKKIEKEYGIKLSKKYHVHHIDLDRDNNEIYNLIILPSDLHIKYHTCLSEINKYKKGTDIKFNAEIHGNLVNSNCIIINAVQNLIDVLEECSKWYDYKMYLEGRIPNIHHIFLDN